MPGSTSRSIRSRASSFPRDRCRSTARSPPPAATCALRSRSSSTSASICSLRRVKSSVCSTWLCRSAIDVSLMRASERLGMLVRVNRNRLLLLGAALGAAAVVVVVVILVAGTGKNSAAEQTTTTASTQTTPAAKNALAGVPQEGDTLGKASAPVTLTVFEDPQCPFCRQWNIDTLPTVVDELRADGPGEARLSRDRDHRPELDPGPARDLRGRRAEQALEHGRGALPAPGRGEQRLDHARRDPLVRSRDRRRPGQAGRRSEVARRHGKAPRGGEGSEQRAQCRARRPSSLASRSACRSSSR